MTFYRLHKRAKFFKTEESLISSTFINKKLLDVRVFAFVSFAYYRICHDTFYK